MNNQNMNDQLLEEDMSEQLNPSFFKRTTLNEQVSNVNNGLLHDVRITPSKDYKNRKDPIIFHNTSESALKGIIEESNISKAFFSDTNMDVLQKTIRYRVYNELNTIISEQSKNELNVIMRSIFLQHGDSLVSSGEYIQHIHSLNEKVADFSVGQVVTQVQQYGGYLNKLSSLPVPIEHPIHDNKRNYTYDTSNLL